MAFDEGDHVILHDQHSEFDGDVGTVETVSETMFGDQTYVISFEEGQEAGISADALEAAPADTDDKADGGQSADAEDDE